MNLTKHRAGLSFESIRKKMSEFYSNENIDSDLRKLSRDIDDLAELGIRIKFRRGNETGENNIYYIDSESYTKYIQFTNDELEILGEAILENLTKESSRDLFTASQKIFHSNLKFFPEIEVHEEKTSNNENHNSEIINKLLTTVKDKIPIRITYYKYLPNEIITRDIDPLQITKRNSSDFYILGLDRNTKEKKRFLIPKITKIEELEGDFIATKKITTKDLNYHALNFSVHEEKQLEFLIREDLVWKFENYLFPHPFAKKSKQEFIISTTNQSAIFPFLIKEPEVVIKINSQEFINEFNKFLIKMKKNYTY
ncbi:MAG: WYL domain-containing protein [Leptospiraceae bacterium]|nr:WYL domain-containing protein [Leptospiraceae bacterium]